MRSPFCFAGILTLTFAACGPARAQELAPPGSGVSIQKLAVDNGTAHTVKYFVKGGSPRLQALVRRVEWAENELSVIEQLQQLKLDTVVNDRRVAAFRTAQLTNPYNPPGYVPFPVGPAGGDGGSPLQRALTWQLAGEATPQSALQMIGFLEQMQTDLDKELKALPPQEKKAAEGPIDALRPRLAALTRGDVPLPQPQPVAALPAAQAVSQQPPIPPDPVALQRIEVEWGQTWWPAEILQVKADQYLIHYTGFAAAWDEWVGKDRMRVAASGLMAQKVPAPQPVVPPAAAQMVPQQPPMPPDAAALEQMVRQNQESVSRLFLQTQQQIKQWQPQAVQQHEPQAIGLPENGNVSLWPFWACGGLALACGLWRVCLA
jgi:hypothetical protein